MAQWIPANVMTVEDRITKISNNEFELALKRAWWDKLVVKKPGMGRRDFFEFMLTTAQIDYLPKGQMLYEDIVRASFSVESKPRGKGLQIWRSDFLDDQFGAAGDWAGQMGSAMALDPQYLGAALLLKGESVPSYDGKFFFAKQHPIHLLDASKGTYDTLIDDVVQLDATLASAAPVLNPTNYALAMAYVRAFKMANGNPRNLRPSYLLHGPKTFKMANEVTGAKFISATENVLTRYECEPVEIAEITGNDWYLCSTIAGSDLMPIGYLEREAFYMASYDGITQAQLNRMQSLEWQVYGRAEAFFGHPFQLVKFKVP